MNTSSIALFVGAVALGLAAPVCTAQSAAAGMEEATRLQVFLDRANFGPGKIDGRYGGFTSKALALYREANGLPLAADVPSSEKPPSEDAPKNEKKGDDKAKEKPADEILSVEEPKPKTERTLPLPELGDMDLKSVGDVFVEYQVTEADAKAVGEMPTKVPAMAETKWLPYATLGEMVAEKFHCDIDFLKELNPGKIDGLKPGDTVKVPNVEPFDVAGVKELPVLDQLAMKREDAEKDDAEEKSQGKKTQTKEKNLSSKSGETYEPSAKPAVPEAAQLSVEVHTKDNMLRLLENGKLVAAYPVTIGSEETKSPQGEWKVRGIARLPDFRYDSSFLKTGERGDKTYLLPPGPNNLVGVVWIALNKRGIGLHGTGEPDSIGRSASHGCVRLANWDVARLATQVRAGVKVTID